MRINLPRKPYVLLTAAVIMLAVSPLLRWSSKTAAQTPTSSAERNKAIARRFFDEVFNQGKMNVVDEIFDPKYVGISSASLRGPIQGPKGIKEFVAMYRTGFPDLHFAFEDILTDGDKVIVRWTTTGTHKGNFFGISPTGKSIKVTGIGIAHIVNLRIAQSHSEVGMLTILQQLGVVPPTDRLVQGR